jgi:hypothetical protein
MRILGFIGLSLALLGSGCSILSDTLDQRVARQETFAMVGTEQHTDQFLIRLFGTTDAILIRGGAGGDVDGMIRTLDYLDKHPEKLVVIDGPCYSACTMLLARPKNVVFTENASFLFHSARVEWRNSEGEVIRWELSYAGNEKMLDQFPIQIQEWIVQRDAFASREFTEMTNNEVTRFLPKMRIQANRIPKFVKDGIKYKVPV